MGSAQGDYHQQVSDSLAQANLPKSALSQGVNTYLTGQYPGNFNQLANAGQLGNAFPGLFSGYNTQTPGQVFNTQSGGRLNANNLPNGGLVDGNPSIPLNPPHAVLNGTNLPSGPVDTNPSNPSNPPTFSPNSLGSSNSLNPNMAHLFSMLGIPFPAASTNSSGNGSQISSGQPNPTDPGSSGSNGNLPPIVPSLGGNLGGDPSQGIQPPSLPTGSTPQNLSQLLPQASQATSNNLNLNSLNPQALQTLLSQVNAPGVSGYNPSASILGSQGANQVFSGAQGLQTGLPSPQNSDYYNALSQTLNQQVNASRADLNARFGASGGSSRGTPAMYANAQFDQQVIPQLAASLGQAQQQDISNQLQSQNQGNQAILQNYLGTAGLNQSQLGLLGGLANQAGTLNLGQNQLGSGNALQAAGLQSQNASNLLGIQSGNQLGQNQLLAGLNQFNAGQSNTMLQNMYQQLQGANQQQIQNQFTGQQNLAQIIASLAAGGMPGGSANVNLGTNSQSGIQQILGAL